MPTRERIILVIAAGLAFATVAGVLSFLAWDSIARPDGGWYAYAPNTGAIFSEDRSGMDQAALLIGGVWLVAIAIWAVVALRILRRSEVAG